MFRREDICVTLFSGDGDFLANLSEQFLPPLCEFFRFRQPALNYVVISNFKVSEGRSSFLQLKSPPDFA